MPEEVINPSGEEGTTVTPTENEQTDGAGKMTLEEINASLGRNYATKEEALKGIKSTFNYVGKKTEVPQIDTSQFVKRDELEAAEFFAENPEMKPYKAILGKFREEGQSFEAVLQNETVKSLIDKAKAYDEVQKSKSVLESNPRLGQVTDKLKQSREALAAGDRNTATQKAVESVLEAYDMK